MIACAFRHLIVPALLRDSRASRSLLLGIDSIISVPKSINKFLHTSTAWFQVVPFKLSDIGEGIREVVIKEWHVKSGDSVHQFDPICEVQSDKATVTITSRYDGVIRALHFEPQGVCAVGQPLVDIELQGGSAADALSAPAQSTESQPSTPSSQISCPQSPEGDMERDKILTTPSVRRIAMENKINLAQVPGSGKDGRILKEDILQFLGSEKPSATKPGPSVAPRSVTSTSEATAEDKNVPLSIMQRAMKASMTQSNQIPHFVLSEELDLTELIRLRDQCMKEAMERHNVKITYLPFFIKAASLALFQYPMLNAYVDENCDKMIYKGSHNIGIAMDTPDGLIVPNVKSVERLSVIEIAAELRRMQDLGSRGKLGSAELEGGTMTLSNIGSIGGTYTAPRLLPPQVLIGGLGRIQRLPRFDGDGSVRAGHILNVSWAADHRVIDGATVTRFSKAWRNYLENPTSLVLELK